MAEEIIVINAKVPIGMDQILREMAAKRRKSRSEIVRIAIFEFVDKYRVVGVSELPGPATGEAYTPVPVVVVEKIINPPLVVDEPDGE